VASAFLSSFFLASFISVFAGAVTVVADSAAKALTVTKVAIRIAIVFI
jgi:hypothetical protein